jgi:large subunit ribosomal protein L13e
MFQPVVQAQTIRYGFKTKVGRGFTLEEIKRAGLNPLFAMSVGIKFDHRRKNRSEETLQRNVQRLEEYKSKITLLPRKPGKPKKGPINDSS